MKKIYRFVEDFTSDDVAFLATLGIKAKEGFDAIMIDADSPQLNVIKKRFRKTWTDTLSTEMVFDEQDLKSAKFLHIYAEKYLGYALPDTDGDVFDVAARDQEYGILRGEQTGFFKMKGEPKWGKWKIASLHFTEHIFFVNPVVYEDCFKPLNIACKPVLDLKTKAPLKTIVQLVQQGVAPSKLHLNARYIDEMEAVQGWNLTKYVLRADMPYPMFEDNPGGYDFFYTQEYFGSGGFAQRGTIISNKLYEILLNNNLTGLNYHPLIASSI
ncbi:hypothetical protein [Chitinophaga arvensicola]|uniref:Uncharacterized protein n=1 Tax=Chitinophaga arvensicola TaxID=29529 RepID=A0A1I0SAH3_9BACT|nr:hypothetical protein [Chitinophaga arvensicola]SEW53384.1 hypothetical protein SAMN04488122_5439 [Chitinophaga arvensicola]